MRILRSRVKSAAKVQRRCRRQLHRRCPRRLAGNAGWMAKTSAAWWRAAFSSAPTWHTAGTRTSCRLRGLPPRTGQCRPGHQEQRQPALTAPGEWRSASWRSAPGPACPASNTPTAPILAAAAPSAPLSRPGWVFPVSMWFPMWAMHSIRESAGVLDHGDRRPERSFSDRHERSDPVPVAWPQLFWLSRKPLRKPAATGFTARGGHPGLIVVRGGGGIPTTPPVHPMAADDEQYCGWSSSASLPSSAMAPWCNTRRWVVLRIRENALPSNGRWRHFHYIRHPMYASLLYLAHRIALFPGPSLSS